MSLSKHKVTCLKCEASDVITIDDGTHVVLDYEGKVNTPFLSFRWRGDSSWGFLCYCGNDNRLSAREQDKMDDLVAGDKVTIEKIAESLKIPDEQQFSMEAA